MTRHWTFGQKIGAGFALTVTLAVAIGAVGIYALRQVVSGKDRVIQVDARLLIDAELVQSARDRKQASFRGFLLTRDEKYIVELNAARSALTGALEQLKRNVYSDDSRRLLEQVEGADRDYQQGVEQVIALRRTDAAESAVNRAFEALEPFRERLGTGIRSFTAKEQQDLDAATQAASDAASSAMLVLALITVGVVLCAGAAAVIMTRGISRQIGSAVSQVRSSSTELQAVATQQATGAREQSTAMNEISTTISELLATSRQITESSQRVALVAERTAAAARSGDETVRSAHESIEGIRRQVDLVVGHMLDLGKKSQQIGAVLEIVSELAEQTNILAINATIEAAGAGESGKRFGVVADEIRKLADRVAGSAKEIRGLIDDVRSSVNTTVMATETGSKAVDAGSRQFGHVAVSFKQISDLVVTTTEAAREIELSTKQQMTAVEQVNVAIANMAQASREMEASSGQTQQTASQLSTLSTDLLRLVRPLTRAAAV